MIERVALLSVHSSPLARVGSGQAGGMNIYVRRLAEGLSRQGLQVDMFTRRADWTSPEVVTTESGARLVHLEAGPAKPLPRSVLPLHVPGMVAALREFTEREGLQYDVLHSHYWLSGLVAARARPDDRTPVIHMFHTLSKVKELHAGHPDPHDSALRGDGERCVINGADGIVGATDSEKEYIERLYGRSPAHFSVIPPGVDLDQFRPRNKEQSRRALGIEADRVILFVGRLEPMKGLDLLLRAAADVVPRVNGRINVVVLGHDGGDRRELTSYRRLVQRLGIEQSVDFRGVVSHEELPMYYSAADMLAAPSVYESFGMAALEAMACRIPVLAFRVGGLAALVRHDWNGLLATPGDYHDFTAKLHTALTAADLGRMGRRARLTAQQFSWDMVTERTLALYDRLVRARYPLYRPASAAR